MWGKAMSPIRTGSALILLSAALVVVGCGDAGGGRSASSRAGKSRNTASKGAGKQGDLDNLSPEMSMQRDLERLREREKSQAKVVKEMRGALSQGEGVVEKEEQKLTEIRGQIAEYDNTMRRYGTASAGAPARGGDRRAEVAAATMRTDDRNVSNTRGRNESHAVPASAARDGDGYSAMRAGYTPGGSGGEEVLYSAPTAPARQVQTASGGGEFESSPFAGARAGRSQTPAPAPMPSSASQQRVDDDENIWNPPSGNLFSSNANSSIAPPLPKSRHDALKSAPARAPQAAQPVAKASVKPTPAPMETFGSNDEFSPDLFLSGGR